MSPEFSASDFSGRLFWTHRPPVLCLRIPSYKKKKVSNLVFNRRVHLLLCSYSREMIAAINHSPKITIKPKHTQACTRGHTSCTASPVTFLILLWQHNVGQIKNKNNFKMPEVTTDTGGGAGSSGERADGGERSGGMKLTPQIQKWNRICCSSAGRATSVQPIDH